MINENVKHRERGNSPCEKSFEQVLENFLDLIGKLGKCASIFHDMHSIIGSSPGKVIDNF
jgi:hypothetical protein